MMSPAQPANSGSDDRGSLLAFGFGTSVLMWATAYAALAPGSGIPVWLLIGVLVMFLGGAGFMATRLTGGGPVPALKLGLLLTCINFLIIASLNGSDTTRDALVSGVLWIGGFAIVALGMCFLGACLAGFKGSGTPRRIEWTSLLALIVAITTLPLIVSGGVVTGLEAGMAVPDWLTTFDYPMIFYPLVKMQEDQNVYAEHFHRLWGLLVGLSVLTLLVHMHLVESRRWVKRLSIAVLLTVIIQGVLGGTRVTENNLILAIVHGVFGQLVFATIVCMAAFCSNTWKSGAEAKRSPKASFDIRLTTLLSVLFVVQLVLGALYRHLNAAEGVSSGLGHGLLGLHVLMACAITVLVFMAVLHVRSGHKDVQVLQRTGGALLLTVGLQLLLGFGAMMTVLLRKGEGDIPRFELIVTTAHQTLGAILLACSALLAVWMRRMVRAETD